MIWREVGVGKEIGPEDALSNICDDDLEFDSPIGECDCDVLGSIALNGGTVSRLKLGGVRSLGDLGWGWRYN